MPLFKTCVGSYGGTLLIFEAEIQLTKNVMLRRETSTFTNLTDALADWRERSPDGDLGLIWVGKSHYYSTIFTPVSSHAQVSTDLVFEGTVGSYWDRLMIDLARFLMWLGLKSLLDWFYERYEEPKWTREETKLRNEFMNVPVNAIYKIGQGIFVPHEFWLVEYFVKEEDLVDLLHLYHEEFKNVFTFNTTIRFIPKCTTSSTVYAQTDVWALVICWDQIRTAEEDRKSEARNFAFLTFLRRRSGKFYLPYRNRPADMVEFYPVFARMIQEQCPPSLYSNVMIEKIRERGGDDPGFDPDTIRVLNEFDLRGSLGGMNFSNVPGLISAAEHFDIPELHRACWDHVNYANLTIDDVCHMLMSLEHYSERYNSASQLLNSVLEFCEPHAYELFDCPAFLSLSETMVQKVMSRDLKVSEIWKYRVMSAWAIHNGHRWSNGRNSELVVRATMRRLGRELKLDRMSPTELIETMLPSETVPRKRIWETLVHQERFGIPVLEVYFEACQGKFYQKPTTPSWRDTLQRLLLIIVILFFYKLIY